MLSLLNIRPDTRSKLFPHLLKRFTAWCKVCQRPFYTEHLEEHGVESIRIEHLFEDLEEIEKEMDELNLLGRRERDRLRVVEAFGHHLKCVLVNVDRVLKDYAEEF